MVYCKITPVIVLNGFLSMNEKSSGDMVSPILNMAMANAKDTFVLSNHKNACGKRNPEKNAMMTHIDRFLVIFSVVDAIASNVLFLFDFDIFDWILSFDEDGWIG